MENGINVSYLLSEEETIEAYCILCRMTRQKKLSLFFVITGLCCITAFFLDITMDARLTFSNVFILILGIAFCLYYDVIVLRIDAKKRAKKQYELTENKKLSIFLRLNDREFEVKTDRCTLNAQPEQMWKCVETKLVFYIFTYSEAGVAIPKRALTQPEIGDVRQVFQQALPQGKYVSYGR